MQRILALSFYFFNRIAYSFNGLLYLLGTIVYWLLFFPPAQETPSGDYYLLVIGAFGAVATFLITPTVTAHANRAIYYPFVVRLSSRIEYLISLCLSILLYATALQSTLAFLALIQGPALAAVPWLIIPPIWLSVNLLTAVLALHATDFVTAGWSRVYVYGILAIFLFGHSVGNAGSFWLGNQLNSLSRLFFAQGWQGIGTSINQLSIALTSGETGLGNLFGLLFWPLRAITDGIAAGGLSVTQALAPAIMLLYAVILFLLAASFFATKNLDFTE